MERFLDPALFPYYLVALVWISRARLALESLRVMPVIEPETAQHLASRPFVSIIVPAKNEERNIQGCLASLLAQDYPHFEIIAVDDRSSDRTPSLLEDLRRQESSGRLVVISNSLTAEKWTGKNFAVHTGAQKAKGEWLLFTDADTRHEPQALSAVMKHAHARDLKFLSLLPRCLTGSLLEDVVQATAMAFLGLWFPIKKINDPKSKTYFANGQYLLMERKLYDRINGHSEVREEFLEDFALMKNSKQSGARVECALGAKVYGTRMYDSFDSIWCGWRRIYLHAFRSQPGTLFFKCLGLIFFSVVPFIAFLFLLFSIGQDPDRYVFVCAVAAAVLLLILVTSWKAYGIVKAKKVFSVFHPVAALLLAMILLDASWMAATKQPTKWR